MKRFFLIAMLLFGVGVFRGQAQSLPLKDTLKTVVASRLQAPVLNATGRSSLLFQRTLALQMRPYLFTPSKEAINFPVTFAYYSPSPRQEKEMKDLYLATYREALEQVHALNTFVYYQGTTEAGLVSPFEIADYLRDLQKSKYALQNMRRLITSPNSQLRQLSEALERGIRYFSALASGMMPSFDLEKDALETGVRAGHTLNISEFFLDTPVSYVETSQPYWPEEFHLAVLNDDMWVQEAFYQFQAQPRARHWKVDIYSNPEEFLASSVSAYDMVLTDVLIPNGGGIFVALQLRNLGFDKPILAITGFRENERTAYNLWDKGMDGMISINGVKAYTPEFLDLIVRKLNNYFYYRSVSNTKQ